MIEVRNLHKSFGKQVVLNGLNLSIKKGELTVIIGRSGEGKSVLLKHLIRLLKPDEGDVLLDGESIINLEGQDLNNLRKKFGMLFQHAALFDSMNIYNNVAFPLRENRRQLTEDEISRRVQEVLDLVGLRGVGPKWPSELSGGMKKRVGLARAIVLEPEIILYDEPTTGLDPIMTEQINDLILDTQKKLGISSVIISHDIEAAFKVADKVALLHEGQIKLEGHKKEFLASTNPFVKKFLQNKLS